MTSSSHSPTRRALTLGALGSAALAACGGGGSSDSGPAPSTDPNSFGGGLTPGSVTLRVTTRVAMTVTMPDATGVDWTSFDLSGFNALPLATRTINIGLDGTHAPVSVANFLAYLNSGAYKNTIFHRVSTLYQVVQGGGYTDVSGTFTPIATNAAIALESRNGLSNTKGTIAMARTSDPNTATSQFYFNVVSNTLRFDNASQTVIDFDYTSADNPGYAVFGTVLDQASMDTLSAIMALQVHTVGSQSDTPVRDITVTSLTIY